MENTDSMRGKVMHDMSSFPLVKFVRRMVKQSTSKNDVIVFNSDLGGIR